MGRNGTAKEASVANIRTGARTFLNLLAKCCKLSRMRGFRQGVTNILGGERATDLFAVWDPLCDVVDVLVSLDNYYNQIDFVAETTGDEDASPPI